jgi:uncharacterized repeat protein (TIGR01451 family)
VSEIHLEKRTNGVDADDPPGPSIPPGDPVTWTYEVSNPGNVAIRRVTVTDDKGVVPRFVSGDADGDGELDPGETWRYEATGTAGSEPYENTATATGLDVLETPLQDTDPSHYSFTAPPAAPPIAQPAPRPPAQPQPTPSPVPPAGARRPSLRFSKVADRSRVRTGGIVRYRLRIRNVGRADARTIRLCDRLPSGLQYAADGAAKIRGRRACFTLRTLRAGTSRTFRLTTRAESVARARTVCNVATLSARGVSSRRAGACIRVVPVEDSCPARTARADTPSGPRPRAHASC